METILVWRRETKTLRTSWILLIMNFRKMEFREAVDPSQTYSLAARLQTSIVPDYEKLKFRNEISITVVF